MLLTLIKDINFLSIQPFSSIGIAICYGIKKKKTFHQGYQGLGVLVLISFFAI